MSISFTDSRWTVFTGDAPELPRDAKFTPSEDGSTLSVEIPSGTDWWRTPVKENASAPAWMLPLPVDRDFEASVSIKVNLVQQFDQAVIFLYMTTPQEKPRWVKAGIERDNDVNWIGSVVTTQFSDWAISASSPALPSAFFEANSVRFSFRRQGHLLAIRTVPKEGESVPLYSRDVNGFFTVHDISTLGVGVLACQPSAKLDGVRASFHDFITDFY